MTRLLPRIPLLDALLGGALAVVAVIEQSSLPVGPQPWIAVVAAVWGGAVLLRTVAPTAMVVVSAAASLAYVCFPVNTTLLTSFVTLLVVTFSLGLQVTGRRLWACLLVLLVSIFVVQITTSSRPGGDLAFADVYVSPFVLLVPVLGGRLLRRSRQQTAELRRLTAELAAEREAHARLAAAAERNRIARELHDVISHSVSVMVVQAGAAEQQLPADSPARDQLHAVRRTGKEALTELRRQLGVLRDGEEESTAPLPALVDVAELAEGHDVTVDYDRDAVADLPPGLALAAYRVVQEALTNARKHAGGAPVDVRVRRDADAVSVDVVNGPGRRLDDSPPSGFGLRGMRERVAMYAGHLEAGSTDTGGWRVHARLPAPPDAP